MDCFVPPDVMFGAVGDYIPGELSRSHFPHLELSLRKGDEVKVIGPMDATGYLQVN